MQTISGKVGIAPGTTTIALNDVPTQDPGVMVPNAYGQLKGYGLGNVPNDFEIARYRGYLPVQAGWISAVPALPERPGLRVEALSGALGCGLCTRAPLGQDEAPQIVPPAVKAQLELERDIEHLKSIRSGRFWGAIGGLAALTTAVVGVVALVSRR